MTEGHLDKWWFYENDKFGKNFFKVWQKLKQDEKKGMSKIVGFTKMTYFAKRTGKFGKDWDNDQSINQSTLLVHPIKMGFYIPITVKSNMNNRNLK